MPQTDTPAKSLRTRSRDTSSAPGAGTVQVLDRAISLLDIIAEGDGMTLTHIAQRAGIATSTAHRILATLEARSFVAHDDERGLWFIGVHAFQIGNAFLRNRKLVDVGRQHMRRLMEGEQETVNLAVEDNGSAVFIAQIECHNAIRAFHRPGSRSPLHASGAGKALLASMAPAAVRAILHRTGLERLSERTIVDPEVLFDELDSIRERGWAIDDEEGTPGMRCVAAPIFNEFGEALAAVSLSGPVVRMSDERLGELGPRIKRVAVRITEEIGGKRPDAER